MTIQEFIESFEQPQFMWGDEGHSGKGLYICEEEYPDEGSLHFEPKEIPGLVDMLFREVKRLREVGNE